MEIKFNGKYKSISDFQWKDIPMFAVISGVNGAGKSQLLELINGYFTKRGNSQVEITGFECGPNEVVYNKSEWQLSNSSSANVGSRSQHIEVLYKQYINLKNRNSNDDNKYLFADIDNKLNKPLGEVSLEEFIDVYPSISNGVNPNRFISELTGLFIDYWGRYIHAHYKGKSEEFLQANPVKPWEFLNDFLNKVGLHYQFINPEDLEDLTQQYKLDLISTDTGDTIGLNDLSSGEKVIISIALYLFNSHNLGVFPKLMLLDEPDAHLHPSLAKQFLDAILSVLVEKYEVRVIMTTHSPSTVALCPVEYLFEMSRSGERIKSAKSKNRLISFLTSGLVTVRSGTKYVMVEDEDDKDFYSMLFDYMSDCSIINPDVPLVFIPASVRDTSKPKVAITSSGGKGPVRSWVEKLHNSGLEDIFQGIIDRDAANPESKGIHLLSRYSFENYLIDPIVVYAALLGSDKQPFIDGLILNFGEEYKISQLHPSQLQQIADNIHSQIEVKIHKGGVKFYIESDNEKIDIEFANGLTLQYPKWLINCRGHDLMNAYVSHFTPKLIRQDLLLNAFRRIWLIPVDFIRLFENIQNFGVEEIIDEPVAAMPAS